MLACSISEIKSFTRSVIISLKFMSEKAVSDLALSISFVFVHFFFDCPLL
jgi:hypothetical protein